jgi:hypothetical protein
MPEDVKEKIKEIEQRRLKRFQERLEKMPLEVQDKFKDYIREISGKKEIHLEILENLKFETRRVPAIREKLIEAREEILKKVKEKIKKMDCPEIEEPPPGFCKMGRIVFERDERGCIVSFKCLLPREVECETFITCEKGYVPYPTGEKDARGCPIMKCVKKRERITPKPVPPEKEKKEAPACKKDEDCAIICAPCPPPPEPCPPCPVGKCVGGKCIEIFPGACIALWDPVCGKDGKTYSNECFARMAGVEIAHKGVCPAKIRPLPYKK